MRHDGFVVSMPASHAVGGRFAPGHTKDYHICLACSQTM